LLDLIAQMQHVAETGEIDKSKAGVTT